MGFLEQVGSFIYLFISILASHFISFLLVFFLNYFLWLLAVYVFVCMMRCAFRASTVTDSLQVENRAEKKCNAKKFAGIMHNSIYLYD